MVKMATFTFMYILPQWQNKQTNKQKTLSLHLLFGKNRKAINLERTTHGCITTLGSLISCADPIAADSEENYHPINTIPLKGILIVYC